VNPSRRGADQLAERARSWWEDAGYAVTVDRVGGAVTSAVTEPLDFAISFGGDGTMLRAVQATAGRHVPVLGVNLGNLGYLTQSEPETIVSCFERLAAGDYEIESRMALSVRTLPGASDGRCHIALNDATVERTAPGHTMRVGVQIDGRPFLTYAADGLLVSTPTGSTAYNLSARGPVLAPELRALVLTAISPHLLFDRSLVLGEHQVITVTSLDQRGASLVVDGTPVAALAEGDAVELRAAPDDVPFVSFGERHFPAVLRAKFSVADR
jgi:NAD+ kinase